MSRPVADLVARVEEAVREVSSSLLEPRAGVLAADEVRAKSPGEIVTVADLEAEAELGSRLAALWPGTPVVGEEACARAPCLLGALSSERAWLLDPLDGTTNFVAGRGEWAVMVALLERGLPVASWIWLATRRRMYVAERGQGASRDGLSLRRPPPGRSAAELCGRVLTGFVDPPAAAELAANGRRFARVGPGSRCAGADYPAVAEGDEDFVFYWRTLAWDHAPGALLVEEAGGAVRRLDGARYLPGDAAEGLLVAADETSWEVAREALLGPRSTPAGPSASRGRPGEPPSGAVPARPPLPAAPTGEDQGAA
ncbi:MAG TPA: inositol monophosphatase family protein [Acidimicrobiales bacterium]|nr:inositol monophosphatase family protein [Acidimicrobiales bacterium]